MGRMITTKEAATILGLAPRTLDQRRLTDPAFLPYYKMGRAVRYDEDEVMEKLKASRVGGSRSEAVQ